MSICLEDYRCKLITKIAYSDSQQEVKRYLDAALKGLKLHQVNGHITLRFLDKVLSELNQYNIDDGDALQWENIQAGRLYCQTLKHSISPVSV